MAFNIIETKLGQEPMESIKKSILDTDVIQLLKVRSSKLSVLLKF